MGYDIYITRRANWYDEEGPEIALQEWQAIVRGDSQLASLEGDVAMMEAGPTQPEAYYFRFIAGQISVKKPSREVLSKMLAIACALNARVIGDEDEIYGMDGTPDRSVSYSPKGDL